MTTLTVSIPRAAWDDALDPYTSDMQTDLGLPKPIVTRRGRGYTVTYTDVPLAIVVELADYLGERAELLAGNDDEPGTIAALRVAARRLDKLIVQAQRAAAEVTA